MIEEKLHELEAFLRVAQADQGGGATFDSWVRATANDPHEVGHSEAVHYLRLGGDLREKERCADGQWKLLQTNPTPPWKVAVPSDIPENSKLSYVELLALGAMGKGVVGEAMLCLSTGSVFNSRPVGKAISGEVEQATEIRQPSSGHSVAVKFDGGGRFSVADIAELAGFDGYVAPRKLAEKPITSRMLAEQYPV
ncbi:hypothetical protein OIV36_31800, partial [Burkholderia pseudomallei]|uniref:hypothetical protein n=1 Tax=Burkholderia pseudomallei TaxID=28450 RepID=UPI0021F781E4